MNKSPHRSGEWQSFVAQLRATYDILGGSPRRLCRAIELVCEAFGERDSARSSSDPNSDPDVRSWHDPAIAAQRLLTRPTYCFRDVLDDPPAWPVGANEPIRSLLE